MTMASIAVRGHGLDVAQAVKQGKEPPSLIDTMADQSKMYAEAARDGLRTGGKATVNAFADTVVSTATLGYYEAGEILTVTAEDRANGYDDAYAASRIGFEAAAMLIPGNAAKGSAAVGQGSAGV